MSAAELERRILAGLTDAQEAYEEFVSIEGWVERGYDSFGGWWSSVVVPTMNALSMRPTREIAAKVDERLIKENSTLPAAQRYTQRDRAELTGLSREAIQDRDRASKTPAIDLGTAPLSRAHNPHQVMPSPSDADGPDYSRLQAELDDATAETAARFRANFTAAVAAATRVLSFDADRIAAVYAQDFDRSVERAFFLGMEQFMDGVREARRRSMSGLRVIDGGVA